MSSRSRHFTPDNSSSHSTRRSSPSSGSERSRSRRKKSPKGTRRERREDMLLNEAVMSLLSLKNSQKYYNDHHDEEDDDLISSFSTLSLYNPMPNKKDMEELFTDVVDGVSFAPVDGVVVPANAEDIEKQPSKYIVYYIKYLFTLICKLPLATAQLYGNNKETMYYVCLKMLKLIFTLIKIILNITVKMVKNPVTVCAGAFILFFMSCFMYFNPHTRPIIVFLFSIIKFISGFDIEDNASMFVQYLLAQTQKLFGILMGHEFVNQILNKIVDKAGTKFAEKSVVGTAKFLASDEGQQLLLNAYKNPQVLSLLGATVGTSLTNTMSTDFLPRIENIEQKITEYGNIITNQLTNFETKVDMQLFNIDSRMNHLKIMMKDDVEYLKLTINMISNNQEMSQSQLNKMLSLMDRNLQSNILRDAIKGFGASAFNPEDAAKMLLFVSKKVFDAIGYNPYTNQYLLKNEGGRGGRRTRRMK